MKPLYVALLIGAMGIVSAGQGVQDPVVVTVVNSSWSKERIGWERDPFSGPLENFDEMRARARNEKRIDDAKRGGTTDVDRLKREAQTDAAIVQKGRQKSPPRYTFLYKAKLKNTSDKIIKAIDWDYVFFDRETGTEIGRQQFTSEEKIAPGKTKELIVAHSKPPAKSISVYSLNKNESEGLSGQVVVVRIEYTDSSVWQRR